MNRLVPYYRARYYAPQLGRFLSRDPLGFMLMMEGATEPSGSAELTQGPNLYWYSQDNPVANLDSMGLAILQGPYSPPPTPLPGGMAGGAGVAGIIAGIIAEIFGRRIGPDIDAINACANKKCKKDCFSCLQSALSQTESDLLAATYAGYGACASAAVGGIATGLLALVGAGAYATCLGVLDDQLLANENSVAGAVAATIPKCQALQ